MYKTCAGILHWGNGQFKQRPREEQAEVADSAGKGDCKVCLKLFRPQLTVSDCLIL